MFVGFVVRQALLHCRDYSWYGNFPTVCLSLSWSSFVGQPWESSTVQVNDGNAHLAGAPVQPSGTPVPCKLENNALL